MYIFCKNRINLRFSSSELLLDPKNINQQSDCIFISHAHTDHLPTSRRKPPVPPLTICSEATARLFYERMGYRLNQKNSWRNDEFSISAVPGGHTFDSTVAEIKELSTNQLIVYTGDVNIEERGYLHGYQPKKCDILIMEATWGDKYYRFPPFNVIIEQARNYIQNQLDKGYPVAVLGYSLGKSQLLNYCLGDLSEYRFSCDAIWKMEHVHRELGLDLFETIKLPQQFNKEHLSKDDPWLLFYNHRGAYDKTLNDLKRKFNLKVVGFSGWAKDESSYKYRMGADAAFTLSDHSDFMSLLEIAKIAQPSKIYTVFGNADKLARELQKEGFNATPLKEGQASIDHYF